MQIIRTIDELRPYHGSACVLTMGALHDGHLSLFRHAIAARAPDRPVIATIFVNPTQFNEASDLERYPSPIEEDLELAASTGLDGLFIPAPEVIYPDGPALMPIPPLPTVATQPRLEDAFRPSHFPGVCQAVQRFFDLLQPMTAYFGEKDYQQLLVIRAMTNASTRPVEVVGCPTIREADGLALSSRNINLSPAERLQALGIPKALHAINQDEALNSTVAELEAQMHSILQEHGVNVDYAVIRNAATLMPIGDERNWRTASCRCRALIAGSVGQTRLIDNIAIQPAGAESKRSAI